MKLLKLLSTMLAAIAVISCSSNEETSRSPYAGQELKFNVSVKGLEGTSTRVASNDGGIVNNTLPSGTQFSIWVYGSAWGKDGTVEYNSNGTTSWVSDPVYYPPMGLSTFWALAPAVSDIYTTLTSTGLTIQKDQSSIDNYKKSDFLFYYAKSSITNPISIQFKHICAKIVVNLSTEEESATGMLDAFTIKMKNVSLTGLTSMGSVSEGIKVKDGSQKADVNLGMGRSMTAVIIPQDIRSGAEMFEISYNSNVYTYKATEDFTFVGGHTYTFNITLKNGQISVGTVSVDGWTDEDPKSGDASKS